RQVHGWYSGSWRDLLGDLRSLHKELSEQIVDLQLLSEPVYQEPELEEIPVWTKPTNLVEIPSFVPPERSQGDRTDLDQDFKSALRPKPKLPGRALPQHPFPFPLPGAPPVLSLRLPLPETFVNSFAALSCHRCTQATTAYASPLPCGAYLVLTPQSPLTLALPRSIRPAC
ncbi:hypothetical protein CYMTET_35497, partial [Cymbomonas tetramitiformis]